MNLPNLDYNPREQNILRSSLDLTTKLENRESLTAEQKKRIDVMRARQYPNQNFGKSNINRDFVIQSDVKRLQERVYTSRQRIGASSISFGDPQSLQEAENALRPLEDKPVETARQSSPPKQRFNVSSISLSPADGSVKDVKPAARVYPGNYQMLKENLNAEIVSRVRLFVGESRLGESNLDNQLNPPPFEKKKYPPTRMGESNLKPGAVSSVELPPKKYQSRMCVESDTTVPPQHKSDPVPRWFRGNGEKPLPPPPLPRQYPNQQGLNVRYDQEWTHKKIKSQYPNGHQLGKSNIGSNLGEASESSKPPVRRGTYEHKQTFNGQSEVPKLSRRASRMGESNFTLG